jgi:hypothetical protein
VSDSVLFYARFVGHIERHSLEYLYFARLNSIHRFNLRQIEKNRFPRKCQCVVCGGHFLCGGIDEYLQRNQVCRGCDLTNKVNRAAETLFHLISAIPAAERDRNEIYPGDFCKARITPPPHNWRVPYGLRDYSEPTKLLNKFGEYESAYRQRAASHVRMTRTTMEYVLGSLYIALVCSVDADRRALANDTLERCASLSCAPVFAPEILRRIASNAADEAPPPSRPKLRLVSGG